MHLCTFTTLTRRKAGQLGPVHGFTLIEIMVAMVLGLVILGVIGQVFMTSRTTSMLQEGLARVQESGRFAMDMLSYDIRMAGYVGCRSDLTLGTPGGVGIPTCPANTICNIAKGGPALPVVYDGIGLKGYRYVGTSPSNARADWSPQLPSEFFNDGDVNPGTDVIVIYRASDLSTHLVGPTVSNGNVQVYKNSDLYWNLNQQGGDVVIVADCKSADVWKTNNLSAPPGGSGTTTIGVSSQPNLQAQLTHSYNHDAQLFKLVSRAYFISNNAGQVPALFRKELTSDASGNSIVQTQELVEGIENMLALYWVGTNFRTADAMAAADWPNVKSVRVGLLVRTPGTAGAGRDTQSYTLDGISFGAAPNDFFRRKVFTLAVQRRNGS